MGRCTIRPESPRFRSGVRIHIMRKLLNCTWILSEAVLLSLTLSAQTLDTLFSFGSPAYDGISPSTGVILGPQGEMYGTTSSGGKWDFGTVYELLPPVSPGGPWTETQCSIVASMARMENHRGRAC